MLLRAPGEIEGLIAALKDGRVNGSAYEGTCACLVGTIANVAHCRYTALPLLQPDSCRPAERWFLAIQPGHTAEKSAVTKITIEWAEEFIELLSRAVTIRTAIPEVEKAGL